LVSRNIVLSGFLSPSILQTLASQLVAGCSSNPIWA
jgi:hypothetical protein